MWSFRDSKPHKPSSLQMLKKKETHLISKLITLVIAQLLPTKMQKLGTKFNHFKINLIYLYLIH